VSVERGANENLLVLNTKLLANNIQRFEIYEIKFYKIELEEKKTVFYERERRVDLKFFDRMEKN